MSFDEYGSFYRTPVRSDDPPDSEEDYESYQNYLMESSIPDEETQQEMVDQGINLIDHRMFTMNANEYSAAQFLDTVQ